MYLVTRRGLLKIKGTLKSTSLLRMEKSTQKMKDATFTKISHKIPTDLFIVWSTMRSLIKVDLGKPKLNYL